MNASTELALKHTGIVTVSDMLDIVKHGTKSLGLHGVAIEDRPAYSDAFAFHLRAVNDGDDVKQISIPGFVRNGHTSDRDPATGYYNTKFAPTKGFWFLSYNRALVDLLEVLPGLARVSFQVWLDAGTNGYLSGASARLRPHGEIVEGLHADHLYLMVEVNGYTRQFLVDVETGAHNSARFGK